MKNLLKLAVPTIVAISATISTTANAFVINFGTDGTGGYNISAQAQASIGANHTVEVTENASGQIEFHFVNTDSTYDSSITAIYFGKDPLFGSTLDFDSFVYGTSVDGLAFAEGANPNDPPPGNTTFASFTAGSTSPNAPNGIGNGEDLTVVFDNISNPAWTLAQIEDAFKNGQLQIVTHVQSIDGGEGGQSQFFASNPPTDVPEPSSLALLALGLAGVGFSRRMARK